jgi:hypothetical protein
MKREDKWNMRMACLMATTMFVSVIGIVWCSPSGPGTTGDAAGDHDGEIGDASDADADSDTDVDTDADGDTDVDGDANPDDSPCDPGVEFPAPEACNGRDDDCDGAADEDMRPRGPCTTECGSGEDTCIDGAWVCVVTDPAMEECNNLDDDCDGETDEGLRRSSGGEFDCRYEECRAGTWVTVIESTGEEVCNGIDDDCDGAIDEGLGTRPCFDPCGVGLRRCIDGEWVCDVALPRPESCDNRDNDCDDEIDEDLVRECPCGMGEEWCDHGSWVGTCLLCTPGAERWCDEPSYCSWGIQRCTDDGRWGTCYETTERPAGCDGDLYDTACCVEAGECCQDYAHGTDASVGNCEDECPAG